MLKVALLPTFSVACQNTTTGVLNAAFRGMLVGQYSSFCMLALELLDIVLCMPEDVMAYVDSAHIIARLCELIEYESMDASLRVTLLQQINHVVEVFDVPVAIMSRLMEAARCHAG